MNGDTMDLQNALRSPQDVLARHLVPHHPGLTDGEREAVVDAGLATDGEFDIVGPTTPEGGETLWHYIGDRWTMRFRGGRSKLVRACDAPPLTAVDDVERHFAAAVEVGEMLVGRRMDDAIIVKLRSEPPWSYGFEAAERADGERDG